MGKLNTFFKVLLGIVLALILVGVALFLAFYLRTPQGLHVVYDGVKYGNSAVGTSSTGISVVRSNSSEFAISTISPRYITAILSHRYFTTPRS